MRAALVGHGIDQSLTPGMHEAEGRAQGLDYTYDRIDTGTDRWAGKPLNDILEHVEGQGYAGLNITHPHKMAVVDCLDRLSGTAEALGAVNTVVFKNGERIGHTTDYSGFAEALKAFKLKTDEARIVQYGAGGAGSATALALIDAGAHLILIDQDPNRAQALARQLRVARPAALIETQVPSLADVDGAINATPVGMDAYPGMAFDPAALRSDAWVADIVYFPIETSLTKAARDRGLKVMNGGAMALYQAVAAFHLITGVKPDPARMGASFDRLMAERDTHATAVT